MSRKIPAEYRDEITECVRTYNGPLYSFLFRFTQGDHALAQDLVQQALIDAAVKWSELRMLDARALRARLYLMANGRAIDTFRKKQRDRKYQPEILACFRQPETDPQMNALTTEAIERFIKVLGMLPPRQAVVATLRWRCGWKNCEIADALEISPGAVSGHLNKAKVTLMRELRPYLPFELANREEEPDHE